MNKVVNGIDDGESGTYICFKQVLHTALAGNLFQFTIVLVFGRSGNLVGSHYRNIVQQQVLVKGSHACTCRTVHKDRVKEIQYLIFRQEERIMDDIQRFAQ